MTQHSPGPWDYNGPSHNIHVTQAAEPHMRVCFLTSDGPTVANARLIAAAPAMLAALQAIRSGVISGAVGGEDVVWFDEITTLYEFCDEIIARATGAGEA